MENLLRPELIAALGAGIVFFAWCYLAPQRFSMPLLLCMIPFQPIDSKYGSLNVLLVYVYFIAYALRGRLTYVPLAGVYLLILGAYVTSTVFADRPTQPSHWLYMFNFVSAILLFYLVYNFVRTERDLHFIFRVFVVMNVLVVIYCVLQTVFGKVALFGIREFTISGTRGDERLTGPFAAVGITGEFLVLSILIYAYALVKGRSLQQRIAAYGGIGLNMLCLLATANRGGFLMLVGAGALFLAIFKSQIGFARAVSVGVVGALLLVIASVLVMNFTSYVSLFDRLGETEISETGIPDTRVNAWLEVTPRIRQALTLGHGPYFFTDDSPDPSFVPFQWPHNLYLYLAYSVGFVGLSAWMVFFAVLIQRLRAALSAPAGVDERRDVVKLGLLMVVAILIDQLKIEFLRMSLVDYWHFLFALFAVLLAVADSLRLDNRSTANVASRSTQRVAISSSTYPVRT